MIFNHTSLRVLTPPATEPVDLAWAKAHLRVNFDDDDALIQNLISGAREYCEWETGRCFLATGIRYTLDRFPMLPNASYAPGNPNVVQPVLSNTWPWDPSEYAIFLPRSPIVSVDSITYVDTQNNQQALDLTGYVVDEDSEPARIAPPFQSWWPTAQTMPGAVKVAFTAGYPSADLVPWTIKQAILLLLSHWYEHREAVWAGPGSNPVEVPMSVQSLLAKNAVVWCWA